MANPMDVSNMLVALFLYDFSSLQGLFRGGSRIYKRGGLTQGTNLLGRDVRNMLELGGLGACPPQENFEK